MHIEVKAMSAGQLVTLRCECGVREEGYVGALA
jgi:hypothetical protein